jgi:gluconokinase
MAKSHSRNRSRSCRRIGDEVRVKTTGGVGRVTESNGHAHKVGSIWLHETDVELKDECPSMVIVLMGVCGCGKTTIGKELSARLSWSFMDADDYHPVENVAKMRRGEPLTDTDRWPWLQTLSEAMKNSLEQQESAVVTCSALKQSYRDVLVEGGRHIYFVHLSGSQELIADRLSMRQHRYMPASLLASQIATLEQPTDAQALQIDVSHLPSTIVGTILTYYGL